MEHVADVERAEGASVWGGRMRVCGEGEKLVESAQVERLLK